MDLVQSVRKEGSRGGRTEFKWDDVKSSVHRENYLGHSLMAPVGRWQKNKDLSWYAKADGTEMSEAEARKEELKRVKRAEDEAMAKALGYELPDENANMTALGERPSRESEVPVKKEPIEDGRRRRTGDDDRERRDKRHRPRERYDDRRHERRRSKERRRRDRSRSYTRSRSPPRHHRRRSNSRDRQSHDRRRRDDDEQRRRSFDDRRPPRRSRSPNERRRY